MIVHLAWHAKIGNVDPVNHELILKNNSAVNSSLFSTTVYFVLLNKCNQQHLMIRGISYRIINPSSYYSTRSAEEKCFLVFVFCASPQYT